jgi:hypothetical protein
MLDRVKAFLPAMQQANEQLAHAAVNEPEALDIENVEEGCPHIEMDLACGVLDLKDEQAVAMAEKSLRDGRPAEDWPTGRQAGDESSSDEDEDEDGDGRDEPMGLDGGTAPETADVSDGQQKESQGAGQKGQRRRAGIVELQTDKEKVPGSELT